MTRPCLRCHEPLVPDLGVLDDARRREITLDFLPLRCRHGHTERLMLERPRLRLVPTCGVCEAPVAERRPNGKLRLNHAACADLLKRKPQPVKTHRYVEIPA